ncbi:MAG: cob(I)yrinic acid a,c-diamide adenosyltransferase [Candidatus Omnitrophota bacterium]
MKNGLIHIYTGDGKGKTTTAVGLACRARAHDLKVCYIYFHKDPEKWGYGEHKSLKKLGVDIFGFAEKHPHFYKDVTKSQVRVECLKGLEFIKKAYKKNRYDLLILDEILVSLREGFLVEKEVLSILSSKPKDLELVLTGRGPVKKIIGKASLVSHIKKIKHPYDSGIRARKGVEY